MKPIPVTCFNVRGTCILSSLAQRCASLLLPPAVAFPSSLETGPQCPPARQHALPPFLIPTQTRPLGLIPYTSRMKPRGNFILEVQGGFFFFLKNLKKKIPLLFREDLCTFPPAVRRGGGEGGLFPVHSDPQAFPGLRSQPWQTSKADTEGSCLETKPPQGPTFLSGRAEEEAARLQPISPQNGNLRYPKLEGINSTAKLLG